MGDFLLGVLVALLIVGTAAVVGFFILRRLFERAAHRVADDIGRVLGDVAARAAAAPPGRRPSDTAAKVAGGRLTNLGAYAAAEGMSEEAARREFAESIERLARLMDGMVRVPGIGPVGLDAVLGLFPVVGDAVSAMISVSLIARSIRYGVPREIIARMLANVAVDFMLGAVPVVGDIADVLFRANLRNIALLREYLGDESRNTIDITATRVS